ncbi:MAG: 50S ribosomal protein L24 [Coriobacteriales bacterium]|jgi:large subunit ribosomal protein L24|nr:50S ribosomal protein L24 [Coriobacteriales bacterium]
MRIKTGDNVVVISGKEKGKRGSVMRVLPEQNRAVVEKVGMVKKAQRPTRDNPQGGITEIERPLPVASLMLVCPNCGVATRVGARVAADGKKVRFCKKCGKDIQ